MTETNWEDNSKYWCKVADILGDLPRCKYPVGTHHKWKFSTAISTCEKCGAEVGVTEDGNPYFSKGPGKHKVIYRA